MDLLRHGIEVLDRGAVLAFPTTVGYRKTPDNLWCPLETAIQMADGIAPDVARALHEYRVRIEDHFIAIKDVLEACVGMEGGFDEEKARVPSASEISSAVEMLQETSVIVAPYNKRMVRMYVLLGDARASSSFRSKKVVDALHIVYGTLQLELWMSPYARIFEGTSYE